MALTKNKNNESSLFNSRLKDLNFTSASSNNLFEIIKENNFINPESLSKDDLSIILKRIDDYNGFYTTQQLENIDYSNFKNHVFFDSAVNKATYAFDRILNYPYDKNEIENIKFNNKTDGYTNYILKNVFPKSKGYVNFSGNQFVVVYDEQGKTVKNNLNKKIGLLNPKSSNFSFDFWIEPNYESLNNENNQVVFSKIETLTNNNINSISNGFLCVLENLNSNECYLKFIIYAQNKFTFSKTKIKTNVFQNIVISVSSLRNNRKIDFLINGNIVDTSDIIKSSQDLQTKNFEDSFKEKDINFSIGGIFASKQQNVLVSENITHDNITLNNFHGKIDEFRFFHKTRSQNEIKENMHKNIFSQRNLVLYLRFNEPKGLYTNSCLIIDYSGNELHGIVYQDDNGQINILQDTTNFKINENTPLKLEKAENSPVLHPGYVETINLRQKIIEIASDYDSKNPNLIFNLMPKHYFLDSADFQSLPVFSNEDAYTVPDSIVDSNGNLLKISTLKAKVSANNELVNIVLIWARFFDQLKCYISSITNLININYDAINKKSIVGMQIPLMCKFYGIDFKEMLPTITKNKLNSENLKFEDLLSEVSIRKIQNTLWQRFLINTQDFLRSKGTKKSIKSVFSSFGIDSDKFIDIREYSSNNLISKINNYNLIDNKKFAIDFGNSTTLLEDPIFNQENETDNKLLLEISNLRSKERNQFDLQDSTVSGIGSNWSIELFFDFKKIINNKKFLQKRKVSQDISDREDFNNKQYLFRIDNENNENLVSVKFIRKSNNDIFGDVIVNIKTIHNDNSKNQEIILSNIDIFSEKQYFSITQKIENNNIIHTVYSDVVGKPVEIKNIIKSQKTKTIENLNTNDLFSNQENLNLKIGDFNYENQVNFISIGENPVFQGRVFKIRLWKTELKENEVLSHIKDINNLGLENLNSKKYLISDFEVKNISSVYDLNTDIRTWQIEDQTNSLNSLLVKSKNRSHSDLNVISFDNFLSKAQNIKFDEINSYNKVNIISYKEEENKSLLSNFNSFPSRKVPNDFKYENINRLSVDMSIVKVINDDISKIISDIETFTAKLSNSHSKYEYNYNELEVIRKDYFEKYSDSNYINYSSIGNIFKYFDNILSSLLYDIVPSRVRFEGFNFVYESHVLERHKYENKNKDSINTIIDKDSIVDFSRDNILSRRNINYNDNRSQIKIE